MDSDCGACDKCAEVRALLQRALEVHDQINAALDSHLPKAVSETVVILAETVGNIVAVQNSILAKQAAIERRLRALEGREEVDPVWVTIQ